MGTGSIPPLNFFAERFVAGMSVYSAAPRSQNNYTFADTVLKGWTFGYHKKSNT